MKGKKEEIFQGILCYGIMPRPNPNFVIGMGVIITMLLDSTLLKHFNTKIFQVSLLVISFARSKTRNTTQKFPTFMVEN
jgi:hypothetical protein